MMSKPKKSEEEEDSIMVTKGNITNSKIREKIRHNLTG
jgi:hypothetical protein